ncbi:WXG100 family type VII secretion target [Streptomyces sp. NPDC048434]|uniref:WXG100 family type VII secretion target n=1 Tax=Streptomyces sp. NPDC048434 TaxID=3365549 RepID=UPI00371DA23D
MSGPASTAVGAYNKVNDWMSGMSGLVDEIMRPLVEPLADQLEFVTGDPETLKAAVKLWRDKADELRDVVADQRRDRADLAHEWTGESAEAFQHNLAELETAMEAEAHDMDETARVRFTGNPVGAAAGVAIGDDVDAAAEKIDEVLTGDKSSSDGGGPSSSGHGDAHLPPASDFAGPPTAHDPPVTGFPTNPTPVAQDPLSRYREPAVEQDPRLVTRPAAAQQPRDPDNPFD